MEIFAVYLSYVYFCDEWTQVIDLYSKEEDAIERMDRLNRDNTEENQSYYVERMFVK